MQVTKNLTLQYKLSFDRFSVFFVIEGSKLIASDWIGIFPVRRLEDRLDTLKLVPLTDYSAGKLTITNGKLISQEMVCGF